MKKYYKPLNIIYKLVSSIEQPVDYYLTSYMRNAYRVVRSKGKRSLEATTAEQCYVCDKFFIQRKSLENHLKFCSSMPGLVYKFQNQNIISFEDNVKFMGEFPFAVYFDFETTSRKRTFIFDEDCMLHPVSYTFVVAFHPELNLEKIFVVRSFISHLIILITWVIY